MQHTKILSLLLLGTLLCACKDSATETQTTDTAAKGADTTPAVTEELWLDDLPADLDLNGQTITVHAFKPEEVDFEEETGEVLEDAVYKRTRDVEERLNFDLVMVPAAAWDQYSQDITTMRASIAAGDNAWQLISGWGIKTAPLALENCFTNLNTVEYLDLSKPWWNQSGIEGCEILGQLYYVTGDIAFNSLIGTSHVMFVNNTLGSNYDIPSIPDLVREGTWTLDTMSAIIKDIKRDINGDSVMDEHDLYGYTTDLWNSALAYYTTADVHQIVKKDGLPVYVSAEERLTTLLEKLYPLYNSKEEGAFCTTDTAVQVNMFVEGRAMIIPRELIYAMRKFREMEDEFTIVPFPKLDEAQENYLTSACNSAAIWSIPSDNPDPNTAAAVLEALAAETYHSVTPVFFETCLQDKYARNEDTIEMLKIIRDTAYVDTEMLMYNMFGGTPGIVSEQLSAGKYNVSSYLARNTKKYEKAVEAVIATLEKME